MNWLSIIVLVCLWFATSQIKGQLYFGNIGGLNGWFGKASDRYFNRILAAQCAAKSCIPYPTLNKEYSERVQDGRNTHVLELMQNFNNQRGNIRVNWSKLPPHANKQEENEPWDDKKTSYGQMDDDDEKYWDDKSKFNWRKWKATTTISPDIVETTEPTITTEATEDPSTTNKVLPRKNESNVTESVYNRTFIEGRSAPLVQVYVVASGSGGAHTNIGDGGFYGENNGHAFSTGKNKPGMQASWTARSDFSGGDGKTKNQKWINDQKPAWSVDDDVTGESNRYRQDDNYSPFMDDTLSESSTKYHFGYHDIEIKPEGLAARTRRRMLRNWHKGDLVNGYWRFWFKK